ncbi:MAG TPA: methionyl-tRNA formyltransferase [Oscillatoriaceae cyanobacterium]
MNHPVLYMGTPSFAVPTLEAMIQAGWPIVGVVCQPDRPAGRGQQLQPPPVKQLALEHGLKVFQPEKLRRNEDFLTQIKELAPALIVVVAYGNILPAEFLEIPRYGCLNVHASLLPKYRGAAPIQWALIRGETKTGVTLMQMDVGMDTGPMLAKAEMAIAPDDTSASLAPKLANLGAQLAVEQIPNWIAGKLDAVPQNDAQATMAPKLTKETGALDWRQGARALHDLVRGVTPWPGATTTLLGAPLKVLDTEVIDAAGGEPGELRALLPNGWLVATGEGALLLKQVQLPGKPARAASELTHGLRGLEPGVRLGALAEAAGG